jgi:hypothetical protein
MNDFETTQTGTSYEPGVLAPETTYYWRIDETNPFGTTTGATWSFTTTDVLPIEFESASSATTGGSAVLSFSHDVSDALHSILVVGVSAEDDLAADMTITSVTYAGVPMTLVPDSTVITPASSWYVTTALYYMLGADMPTAGTHTVQVAFQGAVLDASAGAVSLRYVRQGPPEAAVTNIVADPGATSIMTQITTLTPGAWLVDVVGSGDPGTFTSTAAGMTQRWQELASSSDAAGATKLVQTPSLATMSWNHSTQKRMTHSVAAFAPSGGTCPAYDLYADCVLDLRDIKVLCDQWLDTGDCSASPDCADLDGSLRVDFTDFAVIGADWGL